jgi:ORF6N domain
MKQVEMVPLVQIESRILEIRGQKVMIDADLADIYGVPTKALNQAVKRNLERFPRDFMFQLTKSEKEEVVTNCDHLTKLKFSPALPHVFTEHGAIMAANVLNSPRAVEVSVYVVRAFVRQREMIASNKDLSRKIDELEKKYEKHDKQFLVVFDAIRSLMAPVETKKRKIGFKGE